MGANGDAKLGCDDCNRSGLLLLLLRPSPVAKDHALMPPGAENVSVDENGLISGLVPATSLSESRYALRLLRSGYVHVYIPNPPDGVANWLVYRVTDNADLIPQSNTIFPQRPEPAPCSRNGHNATGMRLLPIPHAHKIDTIWVAYSANLWNDRLKEQNKENPHAMRKVELLAGASQNPGSFRPSPETLTSQVLEFALDRLTVNKAQDHDFAFVSLKGKEGDFSKQMTLAAAAHPDTKDKELAIVLGDPVGLAAELNALRLRRYELAEQYMCRPSIQHPLEVNKLIMTLKGNLVSDLEDRSLDAVAPLRRKSAYEASDVAEGTEWQPLTDEEMEVLQRSASSDKGWAHALLARYRRAYAEEPLGRVVFPDHQERADAWVARETEKAWRDMGDFYDESHRQQWQASFEADMKRQHLDSLRRYESDWLHAMRDPATLDCFAIHYDPQDKNTREELSRTGCSAGAIYTREAAIAFTPEGHTDAVDSFLQRQLDADIREPDAVLLRAMVGNQKSLIDILVSDKPDKTLDLIKGLIGEVVTTATRGGTTPLSTGMSKTVSWLTHASMGFSLGISGTLASVAITAASGRFDSAAMRMPVDPNALGRLDRARQMALIHSASEEALRAALSGRAAKVPVVIMVNCSVDTARQIMRSRGESLSRQRVRELTRRGQVQLAIVTDADAITELRSQPGQLRDELAKSAHSVQINEQAISMKRLSAASATSGGMLTLPLARFDRLYAAHVERVAQTPALMKAWTRAQMRVGTGATAQAVRTAAVSMDGRLAMSGAILQAVGIMNGLTAYRAAGNDPSRQMDAWLAVADASAGLLGASAELSAVTWAARVEVTAGAGGAQASSLLPALRGAAYGMGVASNVVCAWISFRTAAKLEARGMQDLAIVMRFSGATFMLGGVPLLVASADFFMQAAIRRGLMSAGNMAARQVGRVVAARLGTAAVGLSFPGVGWALTIVAVGQTVYVVMNIVSPLQHWLAGCYFGKSVWYRRTVAKRSSWPQEERAFNAMQDELGAAEAMPEVNTGA